jgi:hypothetical protein
LLGFALGCLPLGAPILLTFSGWGLLSFVLNWWPLWIIPYVAAWVGAFALFGRRSHRISRSLSQGLMIGLGSGGALALLVFIFIAIALSQLT